jgi:hypothetical protein
MLGNICTTMFPLCTHQQHFHQHRPGQHVAQNVAGNVGSVYTALDKIRFCPECSKTG